MTHADTTTPPDDAMTPARPPVGTGPTPWISLVLACGLAALGVVGVQEALVRSGAVSSPSWISAVLDAGDGLSAAPWVLAVGVVLVLLGLTLLVVALKPRPRTALVLRAETGVFIRPADLDRLLESRLDGVAGVSDLDVTTSRRRVTVRATTIAGSHDTDRVRRELQERAHPTLDCLARKPSVSVKLKQEEIA